MRVKLSKIAETLVTLKQVARRFNASYLATIAHFLKLYYFKRYRREEIYRLGIADPAVSSDKLARSLSPRRATEMQRQINPKGYDYVTEDKGIFYSNCMGSNIPVPRLYAVFDPSLGWTPNGASLDNRNDWLRFFREELPDRFVIKPSWGIRARSVLIFSRDRDAFVEHSGRAYSAPDLVDTLATDTEFDRFIIQEQLDNHPDLLALTGSTSLQTIRVVTGVDSNGAVSILFAAIKLIGGSD